MNPFERFFSPKKEKDDDRRDHPDQSPENILPELGEVPMTPEIKHNPDPEAVREVIRQINDEEEGEYRREQDIDKIIEERDHKKRQIH